MIKTENTHVEVCSGDWFVAGTRGSLDALALRIFNISIEAAAASLACWAERTLEGLHRLCLASLGAHALLGNLAARAYCRKNSKRCKKLAIMTIGNSSVTKIS